MVTIKIGAQAYRTERALSEVQAQIAEALRGRAVAEIALAGDGGRLIINASMAVQVVESGSMGVAAD